MFIGKQVISYNNSLYEVIKTFKDKEGFPVDEAKDTYKCEIALRRDGMLYFCKQIEEAQIIEEIKDGEIQLVEKEQETSTTPEETRSEG